MFLKQTNCSIVFYFLQDTISNQTQQAKITDKSLSTCSCNQNDDPDQFQDTITTNKLWSMVNNRNDAIIIIENCNQCTHLYG